MEESIIQLRAIAKVYRVGVETIHALRGVDLEIGRNEMVAIMGKSGSGKSTLMNTLGCLDRPTSGEYWLGGRLVSAMKPDELALVRNEEIGFVFQTFELLPRQTALENVELPLLYSATGGGASARRRRAPVVDRHDEIAEIGDRSVEETESLAAVPVVEHGLPGRLAVDEDEQRVFSGGIEVPWLDHPGVHLDAVADVELEEVGRPGDERLHGSSEGGVVLEHPEASVTWQRDEIGDRRRIEGRSGVEGEAAVGG